MTDTPTLRLGTRGEYSDGQHWAFLMIGETCVGAVEDMTPEAMAALESALDPSWAETILIAAVDAYQKGPETAPGATQAGERGET